MTEDRVGVKKKKDWRMKRALRLIYGCDNDKSAEVAYLLSTKDWAHPRAASYTQLCHHASHSLELLSSRSCSNAESLVKFSTHCFVPLSFFSVLLQLLDATSIRNLCYTSKSLKMGVLSLQMTYINCSIPFYCIDTEQLAKKIQHVEYNDTDQNSTNYVNDTPSSFDDLSPRVSEPLSDANNISPNIWFNVVIGSSFLFFIFLLLYCRVHRLSYYFFGCAAVGVMYFIHRRNQPQSNINEFSNFNYDPL